MLLQSICATNNTYIFLIKTSSTYWYILFLLQSCLFLPEALPQLINTLIHDCHLRVALVQTLPLLLQLGILLLVQFVPQLNKFVVGGGEGWGEDNKTKTN